MRGLEEDDGAVRDEVDDKDMTAAQVRAALDGGIPTQVVTSREEFEARSSRGGAAFEVYEDRAQAERLNTCSSKDWPTPAAPWRRVGYFMKGCLHARTCLRLQNKARAI